MQYSFELFRSVLSVIQNCHEVSERNIPGISRLCDMPFLIAWFQTREYTKRMLFCDKVFIFSKLYQFLYNNPISHIKVKYRAARL